MDINILQEFQKGGCTKEQAEKITAYYKKNIQNPFYRTNILLRLKEFQALFATLGKTAEETNEKLAQMPSLFAHIPQTIQKNTEEMAVQFKIPYKTLMEIIWFNPPLLSKTSKGLKNLINAQAKALNISPEEWQKKVFKRPMVLTMNAITLKKYVQRNAKQFHLTTEEWIKAGIKDPQLFCLHPKTISRTMKQNAVFFQTTPDKVMRSFLQWPQLVQLTPSNLQKKVNFLTKMYLNDFIQIQGETQKNKKAFIHNHLLRMPFYLKSTQSLHLRCTYARYLKKNNLFIGLKPLYESNKKILEILSNAPHSFFKNEKAHVMLSMLQTYKEHQNG